MKRTALALTLILALLVSAVAGIQFINSTTAQTYTRITIKADGSISPMEIPLKQENDTYTFTGNIQGSLTVEKDGVVIDGAGYSIQGKGSELEKGIIITRDNVVVKNLQIRNFDLGISGYCSNATITQNLIQNNNYGISITRFVNSNITLNNITRNNVGVEVAGPQLAESSSNNTFRGNQFSENNSTLTIFPYPIYNLILDFDSSNQIDGKPIYFWVNKANFVVPEDAGGVYLVNCTSITVQNLLFSNGMGINLYYTTHSTITNCTIINPRGSGIQVANSKNNTLSKNVVSGSTFASGYGAGINLGMCNSSKVTDNFLINNEIGMRTDDSFGNWIYHNNFVNNTRQIHDYIWDQPWHSHLASINVWDNGYPSGGNYWSDYLVMFPDASEIGYTGIGDTPYVISGNNADNYPLMNPTATMPSLPLPTPTPTPTPTASPTSDPSAEPQLDFFPQTLAIVVVITAIIISGLLVYLKKRQRDVR